MKKFLTMAALALFMMTSCSDDDSSSNNNNTDTVLLKKTIETDEFGDEWTIHYFYEGTKLVKLVDPDGTQTFSYTGDLLTKITSSDDDGFMQEETFTYNPDNTLKTHLMLITDFGEEIGFRYEYTHNSAGNITKKFYTGNHNAQTQLNDTSVITLSNGNITSIETTYASGGTNNITYTFDNKNEPRKNITNYSTFILASDSEGGVNNILTGSTYGESTRTYTYNNDNYPLTSTETISYDGITEVYNTQYFYE